MPGTVTITRLYLVGPAVASGAGPQLTWDASAGADSYWLSIGSSLGAADVFNADLLSAAVSYSPSLASGSYYWRVYPVTAGVLGDQLGEGDGFFVVP